MSKKYLLKSAEKVDLSHEYACISGFSSYAANRRYINACLAACQCEALFFACCEVQRLATGPSEMNGSELTRLYSIFVPTARDGRIPINSTISRIKARRCSMAREQYMHKHALGCIPLSDVALL